MAASGFDQPAALADRGPAELDDDVDARGRDVDDMTSTERGMDADAAESCARATTSADAETPRSIAVRREALEDLAIDAAARDDGSFADEFSVAAADRETCRCGSTIADGADASPSESLRCEHRRETRIDRCRRCAPPTARRPTSARRRADSSIMRAARRRRTSPRRRRRCCSALLVGFAAGCVAAGRGCRRHARRRARRRTDARAAKPRPATPPQPAARQARTASRPWRRPVGAAARRAGAAPCRATRRAGPTARRADRAPRRSAGDTGAIIVRSIPAGAGVTVNGEWRGRTPLTLDDLRSAPTTVRVVQPGYRRRDASDVTLSPRRRRARSSFTAAAAAPPATPPRPGRDAETAAAPGRARSRSLTGSIYVDSRPRGARVLLDGKSDRARPRCASPISPIGSHVVRLELDRPSRLDHQHTRDSPAQETRVTGSLERIR